MKTEAGQPVLIVGAGPTGMTAALDLAHYGIPSIVFDEDHKLSDGSRAIAFHSSALAVWEKLGAAQA
ncbi:MAG: FAD-dependent monooxygenase, partial [Chloroflexota bacterium]